MDWHTAINEAIKEDPDLAYTVFFHDKWRPNGKHRHMDQKNGTNENPYLWMYIDEDIIYTIIEQRGWDFTKRGPITKAEIDDLGNEGWHFTDKNLVGCGFFPLD